MTPLPQHLLTPTPANSPSIQIQTTPVSSTSCEEPVDLVLNDSKHKQTNQLDTAVKALKSFILEELYVIKKTIEDFKVQDHMPNNSFLIQSLKNYLRNKNQKNIYYQITDRKPSFSGTSISI